MERVPVLLLVILLALFHLIISSNAIPSTRSQRMVEDTLDIQAFSDSPQSTFEKGTVEEVFSGRMDMESNDYSGSGANNRHTPKPPGRKLK